MRKTIKQWMKRSLAGFTALLMAFGSVSAPGLQVRAAEAVPVINFTSRFPDKIVLENTGGDFHLLNAIAEELFKGVFI